MNSLRTLLNDIDGQGYKSYKRLEGSYQFEGYRLAIDHVQSDPFAHPSRISIHVAAVDAAFPPGLWHGKARKIAVEDFIARSVLRAIRQYVKGRRGIGRSGEVQISTSGQQILLRNSVSISSSGVEARLTVGLPASRRVVMAKDAEAIFFEELPKVVVAGLCYGNLDRAKLNSHVESVEDQEYLRSQLQANNLVAFVADHSVLPRRSGVDDRPLDEDVVPFIAPDTLARTFSLPNRGVVRGMGISSGVTLIVGGGFHGKSTLLHALERGIYNHIPGDGREMVVTDVSAVKIRAEDNRAVSSINISTFIDRLPFGRDTRSFSTQNASGSTSQAANIIEALADGAKLLLIDDDTSASNFMVRDTLMQKLVTADNEPITPLLERVRNLNQELGVSLVIVMGGSGEYFSVSDTVIMMDAYQPHDVTLQAHKISDGVTRDKANGSVLPLFRISEKRVDVAMLDPARGNKTASVEAKGLGTLCYGNHEIDLTSVEQLVDIGQTRAIGLIVHYFAGHYARRSSGLQEGLRLTLREIEDAGLDILSPWKMGDLAMPRLHEIAAAINRMRKLRS